MAPKPDVRVEAVMSVRSLPAAGAMPREYQFRHEIRTIVNLDEFRDKAESWPGDHMPAAS